MRDYVALIIDIEKSKTYRIDERNRIQTYMSLYMERLNSLFAENIERSVSFSAGDELQGLFQDATTAILYFRLFELLMKPVKVRAGIGIGQWTVKVKDGSSTQQDGPAYHKARTAIEEVYKMQLQNVRICSDQNDVLANALVNASITLKRQQIYMQNIVLVILELLYPFLTKRTVIKNKEIVKDLLTAKLEYKLETTPLHATLKRERISDKVKLNLNDIPAVNPITIHGELLEAEEVILIKNTSSVISGLLDCSRQNVDSIMKRGNAYKIRELDFMVLQYVEKAYGGKRWN